MKLIVKLIFLLMPVVANCQASKAGPDTLMLPSLSREWTIYDFQDVFKSIIARQNGTPAEMITLVNNEPLITKVTSIKNYWFVSSKEQTLKERISFCDSLQGPLQAIFLNYYRKCTLVNGHLSYEKEVAAFLDVLFELTKIQVSELDEFLKTKSSLTQTQTDGLKQMTKGLTTMESGVLITIEKEYSYYSEASICKIARTFKGFYTAMYSKIDVDVKAEFDRRIANIAKTHPLQSVRAIFQ